MKVIFTNIKILAFALAIACIGCSADKANNNPDENNMTAQTDSTATDNGRTRVMFKTSMGDFTVELYNETPRHRDNFLKLVKDSFYNDVLFHRVIRNFMIQTGDPLTKSPSKADLYGTGGPGYTIPAEFNPSLRHKKGALAAARRGDAANPKKESSGSQFYIVQNEENCSQLDGSYTVFGEVIDGIDVVDKIAAAETDRRDRPVNDIRIKSIRSVADGI